jgi:hypothetical protein
LMYTGPATYSIITEKEASADARLYKRPASHQLVSDRMKMVGLRIKVLQSACRYIQPQAM